MTDVPKFPSVVRPFLSTERGPSFTLGALRHKLRLIQWLAPLGMALLVVFYEIGPANTIRKMLGFQPHFLAEILFYGTLGPALVFLAFDLLGRWLEERETSELQAIALDQARELARISHEVTDDALQALFAASVILSSLESQVPDLPPEVVDRLRETNRALNPIMQQLYAHQAKKPHLGTLYQQQDG